MAKQSIYRVLIGGALALALATGVNAEDADEEEEEEKERPAVVEPTGPMATAKMLVDTCAGCHGTNGNSVGPASPSIAGMDPIVFVDMMNAYKSGDTYSTIMGRIAKGYDDAELQAMGEYLHQQTFIPVKQEFNAELAEKGAKLHDKFCEKCHAEGGKPLPEEEDYYILAGQWTPYLIFAMEDFKEDRREMPKKMASKVKEMLETHPEGAFDALWAFYASQQETDGE
jgi:sulfide dehydrogenase cytochrome subunit